MQTSQNGILRFIWIFGGWDGGELNYSNFYLIPLLIIHCYITMQMLIRNTNQLIWIFSLAIMMYSEKYLGMQFNGTYKSLFCLQKTKHMFKCSPKLLSMFYLNGLLLFQVQEMGGKNTNKKFRNNVNNTTEINTFWLNSCQWANMDLGRKI